MLDLVILVKKSIWQSVIVEKMMMLLIVLKNPLDVNKSAENFWTAVFISASNCAILANVGNARKPLNFKKIVPVDVSV